jgi:hypothetical protein
MELQFYDCTKWRHYERWSAYLFVQRVQPYRVRKYHSVKLLFSQLRRPVGLHLIKAILKWNNIPCGDVCGLSRRKLQLSAFQSH